MISLQQRYRPPGYSRSQWAGGWTVERARLAIEQHDMGRFAESWALSVKVSQWSRVFGALRQRIAPIQRFPRSVDGGARGLDRVVREEAERLFKGQTGTLPAFPSFWTTVECLALMGFSWWQSWEVPQADGTRTPQTEFWPPDASWYDMGRQRWYMWTQEEGSVEVQRDDPRWTLIALGEEPWRAGAVRAIGLEYVDAAFARFDRSDLADTHGRPKAYAVMPEGVKVSETVNGEAPAKPTEGDLVLDSLRILQQSDAGAAFAHGTVVGQLAVADGVVGLFKDILESDAEGVAIAILGTDGTVSKGTGGVYSSPMFQGVAENTVASDTEAVSGGATRVLERWRVTNYADARVPLKASIQMPDTNRDARTKSLTERTQAFHAAVKAEKDNGFMLTQVRVDDLAKSFDIAPPILAATPRGAQSFAYDQDNGIVTIGERRGELGLPASDRDQMTVPEYRARNQPKSEANPQNTSAP